MKFKMWNIVVKIKALFVPSLALSLCRDNREPELDIYASPGCPDTFTT